MAFVKTDELLLLLKEGVQQNFILSVHIYLMELLELSAVVRATECHILGIGFRGLISELIAREVEDNETSLRIP